MRANAEILSQGDEVVTGQTVDSNAAWLSECLTDLGFTVRRHTAVGDRLTDIRDTLREAAARSDVCICTGGLGPTEDDLTAQAVADAFERPLRFDPEAMGQIQALFARFAKPMPESNRKQAWLPEGAQRLDNRWGTAPGFALAGDRAWLAFLPGVPREMRKMYRYGVEPLLRQRFSLHPGRLVTLRTVGIGESALQQRIGPWTRKEVALGYRTLAPENHVKLRFLPDTPEADVRQTVDALVQKIGMPVFAVEGLDASHGDSSPALSGSLGEIVGRYLSGRHETLAVVEWGSGGRLSALCSADSGEGFLEGRVLSGRGRTPQGLGLDLTAADREGWVFEAVTRDLAEAIRAQTDATYGLALTVHADFPGDAAGPKPGTTHVALATAPSTVHRMLRLAGDRALIQKLAAAAALDLLRRQLGS